MFQAFFRVFSPPLEVVPQLDIQPVLPCESHTSSSVWQRNPPNPLHVHQIFNRRERPHEPPLPVQFSIIGDDPPNSLAIKKYLVIGSDPRTSLAIRKIFNHRGDPPKPSCRPSNFQIGTFFSLFTKITVAELKIEFTTISHNFSE